LRGDGSGFSAFRPAGQVSGPTFTNTIVVNQAIGVAADDGCTVTMAVTLWGSGPWKNGTDATGLVVSTTNLSGDPAFVDPASLDYHIGPTSSAINAGVDAGVDSDIDGDPRPGNGSFDMGADEYWRRVHLPLIMRS